MGQDRNKEIEALLNSMIMNTQHIQVRGKILALLSTYIKKTGDLIPATLTKSNTPS